MFHLNDCYILGQIGWTRSTIPVTLFGQPLFLPGGASQPLIFYFFVTDLGHGISDRVESSAFFFLLETLSEPHSRFGAKATLTPSNLPPKTGVRS